MLGRGRRVFEVGVSVSDLDWKQFEDGWFRVWVLAFMFQGWGLGFRVWV